MVPDATQRIVTGRDNRATRRRSGYTGPGLQKPIDLGIKAYKKLHGDNHKRVLYYKQEMWNAFLEVREGETNGSQDQRSEQGK